MTSPFIVQSADVPDIDQKGLLEIDREVLDRAHLVFSTYWKPRIIHVDHHWGTKERNCGRHASSLLVPATR